MPDEEAAWRCFVAVEVTDEVRGHMGRLQEKLRRTGAHLSCPDPAQAHLTLVFLGDVLSERIPTLCLRLDEAASQFSGFTFQVSGIGTFGPDRAPRVVWAGVANSLPLNQLQAALMSAVQAEGFVVEERSFNAHVTLARVKSLRHVDELTSMRASIKSVALGEVPVRRVVLMRSHRDQPKARYSLLHESPLKGT